VDWLRRDGGCSAMTEFDSREKKVDFLVQKWGIPRDEAERMLQNREAKE